MRRTLGETKEALEFMEQIDGLSQAKRDHLHLTIKRLMTCYTDPKAHGVVLIDHEDSDRTEMLAINASEMEAAMLVGVASAAMTKEIMADMPDKGMLN
jgi:basic membrane lipoprotein Med (substrate-binding protein (PBP1-ABC) superfamily)